MKSLVLISIPLLFFFQLQGNTFMYFQVFKLVHCPYDYLTGNIKEHLFFYYQIQLT